MFQTLNNVSIQARRNLPLVRNFTNDTSRLPYIHIPSSIFFDWDGTIIRFDEGRFLSSFNQTLSELNYPKSMHMYTLRDSKSITDSFEKRLQSSTKVQEAYSLFKEIFATSLITEADLMVDAKNLVFQINSYGMPMAIISNLDQVLLEKQVAMLNLTRSFSLIIGSASKPKHSSLTQAAQTLDLISGKAIWFIGDSRQTDILAANNAGFTSILINHSCPLLGQPNSNDIEADIELDSLGEVIKLLNTKIHVSGRTI